MIRCMKLEDYPRLISLWSGFPGNAITEADGPEGFSRFLEANGAFCLVAEDRAGISGSVMAGHDTRRGYVYHLAVRSDCQGAGLGRSLMEAVEKSLAEVGIEKIHLFIYTDNPARAFYERIGWFWRNDIGVMSRTLDRGGGRRG